jgi:simple sugar transport system permease protein
VAVTGVFQGLLLFFLLASDVLIHYRIQVGQRTLAVEEN